MEQFLVNPYGNPTSNIKYNYLGEGDYLIDENEEVLLKNIINNLFLLVNRFSCLKNS